MTNLTDRAEQALLGALLQDPGQINSTQWVTVADFASPWHQRVFTAIVNACADYGGTDLPHNLAAALTIRDPELDLGQLRALSESCPRPGNGAAYARMVSEASLRRHLITSATRILEEAPTLSLEVAWLTNGTAETSHNHLKKLINALQTHALELDRGTMSAATSTPEPNHAQSGYIHQEEAVLADLIHNFPLNRQVLEWLPAEAFTSTPSREVYRAIATLAHNAEPIDELTVDWQLARNRIVTLATTQTPNQAVQPTVDPGYVTRLASITATAGTATLTGRILLKRHDSTQLRNHAGPQASSQRRPVQTASPPLLRPPSGIHPGTPRPEPRP